MYDSDILNGRDSKIISGNLILFICSRSVLECWENCHFQRQSQLQEMLSNDVMVNVFDCISPRQISSIKSSRGV